ASEPTLRGTRAGFSHRRGGRLVRSFSEERPARGAGAGCAGRREQADGELGRGGPQLAGAPEPHPPYLDPARRAHLTDETFAEPRARRWRVHAPARSTHPSDAHIRKTPNRVSSIGALTAAEGA